MKSLAFYGSVFFALSLAAQGNLLLPHPLCNFGDPEGGTNRSDDLSYYTPDAGLWAARTLGGTNLVAMSWGWNRATPVPGDYDGDGIADMAVYQRDSGSWFIARTDGTPLLMGENFGWSGAVPVPADYDGDGAVDLAVYAPDSGMWFIRKLDGTSLALGRVVGSVGAVPVPADYDGDGAADLATYNRRTGRWDIQKLNGTVLAAGVSWGWSAAVAVPGDYDGDGVADLAVYHRQAGNWYIAKLNGTFLAMGRSWGWSAAVPVTGDYNGDGVADLAVYQRSAGSWFVQTLSGETLAGGTNWGSTASSPLELYAHKSAEDLSIVAFGDSLTYGRGTSANGPSTAYPFVVEKKLDVYLGGFFRTINAGVPGETAVTGSTRIAGVLDVNKPDLVLIMEGTNDAWINASYAGTKGELGQMIQRAQARGMRVIISTLPPVISTSSSDRSAQAKWIVKFNPNIFSLGSQYHIPVVDAYTTITSHSNWQNLYMDKATGNHLNDAGVKLLSDAFYASVRKMMLDGTLY